MFLNYLFFNKKQKNRNVFRITLRSAKAYNFEQGILKAQKNPHQKESMRIFVKTPCFLEHRNSYVLKFQVSLFAKKARFAFARDFITRLL